MKIKSTLLAVATFVGSVVGASAVEEAPHQVLSRNGNFEIREYPALIVAETTVRADRNSAGSAGFRLLAGYIFGGNAKKQSIAMTAPVIEARPEGMSTAEESGEWVIRFVMPRGFSLANLPKPDAEKIVLREERAARWAVLKFSGLASDDSVAKKTIELAAAMKARNLVPIGEPMIAQYDPPWTLPFLRRNEIMIPIRREWIFADWLAYLLRFYLHVANQYQWEIQVVATTHDGWSELSVTNAGERIPRASLDHIFDPNVRGANRPSRQGLGLGLYIANEIAKAHGGTLSVISTSDQTCFTFRMPLKIIWNLDASDALEYMEMYALNSKAAILVVEDEILIRLWVVDTLEENGFSVLEANNAHAA